MKSEKWGCIALLVSVPIGTVLRGWVLLQLWGWFVVPLGVATISLPWALGLSLLMYSLTAHADTNNIKDGQASGEILWKGAARLTVTPLLAWGIGALWHALM